jgi:hypothetical protein
MLCLLITTASAILIPLERTPPQPPKAWSTLEAISTDKAVDIDNVGNVRSPQMQYRGSLSLGSPPQEFRLIFDTGSSVTHKQWLWVPAVDCACHSSKHYFSSKDSSTYLTDEVPKYLAYGRGVVSGVLANETVSFTESVKVPLQSFILADKDSDFDGMEADGILGLAFNSLSGFHRTFVETLKDNEVIERALFAVYLSDDSYGGTFLSGPGSSISLGEYDLKTYAKDSSEDAVTYLKVYHTTGYWSVNCDSISIGGTSIASDPQLAILDTGTSLILGPGDQVSGIFAYFSKHFSCHVNSDYLFCKCADLADFPDLVFSLESKPFTVPPHKYFYDVKPRQKGSSCQLMLTHIAGDMWILGDVFLRNYYSIFDMDNNQVGLTEATVSFGSSPSVYLIIALVVLVVVLLILAYSLAVCLSRRWRRSTQPKPESYIALTEPTVQAPVSEVSIA